MENHPLVSIVMPTYNNEWFLSNAIDSCLNQTHSNIELIIVDEMSTDKTERICRGYTDDRIKYYKVKKTSDHRMGRLYDAGFERAKGDFWKVMGGDDVLTPWVIEHELGTFRLLKKKEVMAVCGKLVRFQGLEYLVTPPKPVLNIKYKHIDPQNLHRYSLYPDVSLHRACMGYRFENDEIPRKWETFSFHWKLWSELAQKGELIQTNLPAYYYRRHGGNVSDKHSNIDIYEYTLWMRRYIKGRWMHDGVISKGKRIFPDNSFFDLYTGGIK